MRSSNIGNLLLFKNLQNQLIQSIHTAKQKYFNKISKKLCDSLTSTKCYWSLLKTILNQKKEQCIPPIFHNNKYVTDFKENSEFFDSFFANQCSLIPSNSILPSVLKLLTEHDLTSCDFSETDVLQIIINQGSNKAHGHDMISIRLLKLWNEAICRPLNIIFKTCLNTGKFPSEWKKGNVVPIHKKDDKQNVKNYRPVSLLPICGKIFERLIYNVMYDFLTENDLLSPNQSGFRSGDSCINQLLSINHEILNAFDKGLEVRGIFLDISKAFDKVWHDGLVFNLRQNGISGDIMNILQEFIRNRKQSVVLNGHCHLGLMLMLVFLKDNSLDLCYS